MSINRSSLGRCPDCGATIPAMSLLIEYETARGNACYAECPDCRGVVHPQEA